MQGTWGLLLALDSRRSALRCCEAQLDTEPQKYSWTPFAIEERLPGTPCPHSTLHPPLVLGSSWVSPSEGKKELPEPELSWNWAYLAICPDATVKSFLGPGPYLGVQVPYPELSHWEGRAWPASLGPSGILEGRKYHLMVLRGHSWQCSRDARDWTWVSRRPGQCPLPCAPQELPFETQSQPHTVSSKKSPEARGPGKEVEKQDSCSAEGTQGSLAGGNVWRWVQKASLDGDH